MGRGALVAALLLSTGALAGEGGLRGTVKLVALLPDGSRQPLPDASKAVVYVPDFDQEAAEKRGGRIEQKNKAYVPDVLPVVKGQSVEFVNDDPLLHNVFSNSTAAGPRGMDLGKYKGPGESRTWRFTRTGIVEVYCDIHESMAATILVLPNPAFARPAKDGSFQIAHLPAGHHVLYVWTPGGKKASLDLEIEDGKVTTLKPLEVEVLGGATPHKDKYGRDYASHAKAYDD